jgi:hypothetical protein
MNKHQGRWRLQNRKESFSGASRFRAQSSHVGFVVNKVALEQGFSEYFGFPCQSSFHQILHPYNHAGQLQ